MTLDRIIRKGASLIVMAGLTLGSLSCNNNSVEPVPHFDIKYAITDANGYANFTDNEGASFSIPVLDGDGARSVVEGALVTFFDGVEGDAFYAEHPDYGTAGFDVFASTGESNSTAKSVSADLSLTLTSNTAQWWGKSSEDDAVGHEATRDFVTWATQEKNNSWGYYGCSTRVDMEDGHKFAAFLYAGASKLAPVAAVMGASETITSALELITGEIPQYEFDECEAFQYFGFIPNYSGWTTPTGGILLPFCYTPEATEIITDDGIDNDCNGIIDEGGSGDDEDTGDDDDDTTPGTSCTGLEYLCDDFEDNSLSSMWSVDEGSVSETDGRLKFNENSTVSTNFSAGLVDGDYSFKLLSEIIAGEDYTIGVSNGNFGWVRVTQDSGSIRGWCYDNVSEDFVYGNSRSLATGSNYDLEISVYGGHTSVFVDNLVLFSQDDCWTNDSTTLSLYVESQYGTGVELEDVEVDEF